MVLFRLFFIDYRCELGLSFNIWRWIFDYCLCYLFYYFKVKVILLLFFGSWPYTRVFSTFYASRNDQMVVFMTGADTEFGITIFSKAVCDNLVKYELTRMIRSKSTFCCNLSTDAGLRLGESANILGLLSHVLRYCLECSLESTFVCPSWINQMR